MRKRSSGRETSEQRAPGVKTYTISRLESKQVEPRLRAKVVHAARMTVTLYSLRGGDLIVIPAGVPHSAKAGSAGAEVLSVVSPPRRGARPLTMLEPNHRQKR